MTEPLLQDVDKIYTEELIPQPLRVLCPELIRFIRSQSLATINNFSVWDEDLGFTFLGEAEGLLQLNLILFIDFGNRTVSVFKCTC